VPPAVNVRLHLAIPSRDAMTEVDAGVHQCFDQFSLTLRRHRSVAPKQTAAPESTGLMPPARAKSAAKTPRSPWGLGFNEVLKQQTRGRDRHDRPIQHLGVFPSANDATQAAPGEPSDQLYRFVQGVSSDRS